MAKKVTIDIDKIERLAFDVQFAWSPYKRDGDYVHFGPVDSHKDNYEGDEPAYKLIGYLTPARVLELARLAGLGQLYEDLASS